MRRPLTISFFVLLFVSCRHNKQESKLFSLVDDTGIDFNNRVVDKEDLNIVNYRNFYNGGGVAIGDINNDGLPDVFFTANQGSNKLYLNKGGFKFQDISDKAGFRNKKQWSTGVVMVDINNDGWLDIYVCNAGSMDDSSLRQNQLFINNHDLTFTEEAAKYGLNNTGYTTQASFFDYDMDGDLDCFLINNSPISPTNMNYANERELPDSKWPVPDKMKGGGDHLFRNDNGHFVEVTKEAGIHGSLISFGLGVTVGDVNDDGYPDVYVSNDFYERDYLYINQKNGTFKDELEECMQHTSLASMGADIGDINNDGLPDIFTTDMLPDDDYRLKTTLAFEDINVYRIKQRQGFYHQFFQNTLQLNNGNGSFCDVANYAGVSASDWSWGGLMFDMDNDSHLDLYVCNGINHDLINQDFLDFSASDIVRKMQETGKKEELNELIDKMPSIHVLNKVFQNQGNLKFRDVGAKWGFTQASFSNGAAYADLDNDGDLDVVVNNVNQPCFIYKNNSRETNGNNYIAFSLQGTDQNRFAIGSKIKVYANGQVLSREIMPSRGFQSSIDYKTLVGLGEIDKIDSVLIEWPDLSYSKYISPAINKTYAVKEKEEKRYPYRSIPTQAKATLFTQEKSSFEKHTEDDYVDFYQERNIPRMLSREGPKAAVGDVNGDRLEDLIIGGTVNHPAQVYIQSVDGSFKKKTEPSFAAFSDFEDVAMLLFDADKDGDSDLLICPGGNAYPAGSRQLQLRLFKNDGQGNFVLDANAFPQTGMNISVAVANDFNGDGFEDLFVGGRSFPQEYGIDPRSFLFLNDGKGHFIDVTEKSAAIKNIGMVTSAVFADVTGDQKKELIIVGEWMAPRIFTYSNGHFEEVNTNLSDKFGWWQTVAATDVNKDGKQDLIFGNIGENFYLRPDKEHPVKLWVGDFDNNGIVDKVLSYTVDGTDKPVFLKHDLEDAMPFLKKKNLRHEEYAKKSVEELIPADALKRALIKKLDYTASIVAINNGGGNFSVIKLPPMVQLSSVNAIHCIDVNSDGFPDLVLGGNLFGFQPQLEQVDGSPGDVLINNRGGSFLWTDAAETGLLLKGQLKDIAEIHSRNKTDLLFLQNDEQPLLYKINTTKQ